MRKALISVLAVILFLSGCNGNKTSRLPEGQNFIRLQTEEARDKDGIIILKSKKDIKRGEKGEITIKGKAGHAYKITATYTLGNRKLTVNRTQKADKDGVVSWSWTVGQDTTPGTYPVTITGGGTTLLTSYKVT